MLPTTQIGHSYKNVIVNKSALQAWLLAWTFGESFPIPTSSRVSARQAEQLTFTTLRRFRQAVAKQPKR
jgi:hypothetical protein